MLTILQALLCALGLAALIWIFISGCLLPVGEHCPIELRITAAEDGAALEQTVKGVCWLMGTGLLAADMVLLNVGLNEQGRRRAEKLLRIHPNLRLETEEDTRLGGK